MRYYRIFTWLFTLITLSFFNCATFKTSIKETKSINLKDTVPTFKVYMIGDAGQPENGKASAALKVLENEIKNANKSV